MKDFGYPYLANRVGRHGLVMPLNLSAINRSICYKHINQIRCALHVNSGAYVGTWRYSPRAKDGQEGAQIDLLFDRQDWVITLCEIKCSDNQFAIDKSYYQELVRKMEVFRKQTRTKKQLFLPMVTTYGLKKQYTQRNLLQVKRLLKICLRKYINDD